MHILFLQTKNKFNLLLNDKRKKYDMKKIRFTRLIFYAFKTKSPLNNSHPLDNFGLMKKKNYDEEILLRSLGFTSMSLREYNYWKTKYMYMYT